MSSTERSPVVPPLAMNISAVFDSLVGALHTALPAAGFPDIRPAHSINLFRVIDAGGTRPSELARRAGVTPQAMAEIIRYLGGHGYAERVPDPSDGRARIIRLTPRGHEAAAVAGQVFAGLETTWEQTLGQARMIQLRAMLAELASLRT
ncbi:MAG: MarR family winged helix-turn-helix transcriptional regulator [Actinomycetota bacterium]|nr:MarR family winged helix-turn-helix transcriptional regulator [Actinomycetota bacterium]